MADPTLVRKNVRRMIEGGASDSEIQEYMAMEGATPEILRNAGKKPQQSSSERFMRRMNDTLTFGLNDEFQAGVKTLFGSKSYSANLADERRKLKDAKSNSSLVDVVPDTTGMVVSGLATLPGTIAKTGTQAVNRMLFPASGGAQQAAKQTAQVLAPQTKRQILGEATRVGGAFGAGQAYGTSEGENVIPDVFAGTAGGAILGRALPSVSYGIADNVVAPIANAMRRQRSSATYGPAQAAREFDEAGVNPFGPAMAPGTPVATAAKSISRSIVGKPLREAAERTNVSIEQRLNDTMIGAGGGRSTADVGQDVQGFLRHQITGRSIPHSDIANKAKSSSTRSLRELEDLSQTDAGGLPLPQRVQAVPPKAVRPVEPEYPPASEISIPRQEPVYPTPRMPKAVEVDETSIANRIKEPFLRREQELLNQEKALRREHSDTVKAINEAELPPGVARTGFSPDELKQLDAIRTRHEAVNKSIAGLRKEYEAAKTKAVNDARRVAEGRALQEAKVQSDADRTKAIQDAANREQDAWQRTYDQRRNEAESKAAEATAARVRDANIQADRLTRSDQARSDRQFQQEIDAGDYSRTFGGTRETYPTEFDAGYALAQRRFYPPHGSKPTVNLVKDGARTRSMLQEILREGRKSRVLRGDDINSDEFKTYLSKRIGKEAVDALYGSSRGGGISLDGLRQLRTRVREASDAEAGFRGASDAVVKRLERAISADYHAKLGTGTDKTAATIAKVTDARYAAFTKQLKRPLRKVFGEDITPEQGLKALLKSTQKIDGNERLLKSFVRVYQQKGDQRRATVAVLTPMMSDGMESFAKGWDKMSDSAKNIVYAGASRELRESHERLIRLYKLMEPYRSKGANGVDINQGANWALAAGMLSNITAGITMAGGAHVMARLMASPRFVTWLTKIPNGAQRSASRQEMLRYMSRLNGFLVSQAGLGKAAGNAVFETINPFGEK